MAWRNVRRNFRHSLATVATIAIGFVAIGLLQGYVVELMRSQTETWRQRNAFGDLLVQKRGAFSPAGREDPIRYLMGTREQDFLERYLRESADQVRTRVRFLVLNGLASAGGPGAIFVAWGYDIAEGKIARGDWVWNAWAGKPLHLGGKHALLLGRTLGSTLDCEPASDQPVMDPVRNAPIAAERPLRCRNTRLQLAVTTPSGQLNAINGEVVGVLEAGLPVLNERIIHMPLPLAQELLDTQGISMASVLLEDRAAAPRFIAGLQKAAAAEGLDLEVMPWTEHNLAELMRRAMDLLSLYQAFVGLVVVAIAGMAVLMTMMKTVSERTREVGTLRSLGFRRGQVVRLFVLESAMLAGCAAIAGLAATVGLTALVNHAGITYKGGVLALPIALRIAYGANAYALAFVFLTAVAMLAALVPARSAAQLAIPDALAHV
jgi:putative ABC transport system permease protein